MADPLKAGRRYAITRDIYISGKLAFGSGETAKVEKVVDNPVGPGHQYVVFSNSLSRFFRLNEIDLAPIRPGVSGGPGINTESDLCKFAGRKKEEKGTIRFFRS